MVKAAKATPAFRQSPPAAVMVGGATLESECLEAWQGDCWKMKPFTDCCSCDQNSTGAFGCHWDFTFKEDKIGQDLKYDHGETCQDFLAQSLPPEEMSSALRDFDRDRLE